MKTSLFSATLLISATLASAALARTSDASASPANLSPSAGNASGRVKPPLVLVVDTPPPPAPAGVPLRLGLKRSDIRGLLGKPVTVRPIEIDKAKAEVWVYVRAAAQQVRPVAPTVEDEPWVDPISGEMKMLKVPFIEYVTETHQVELRLLMFRGQLINWAEIPLGMQRTYN